MAKIPVTQKVEYFAMPLAVILEAIVDQSTGRSVIGVASVAHVCGATIGRRYTIGHGGLVCMCSLSRVILCM